jgi:hypothetical protein
MCPQKGSAEKKVRERATPPHLTQQRYKEKKQRNRLTAACVRKNKSQKTAKRTPTRNSIKTKKNEELPNKQRKKERRKQSHAGQDVRQSRLAKLLEEASRTRTPVKPARLCGKKKKRKQGKPSLVVV